MSINEIMTDQHQGMYAVDNPSALLPLIGVFWDIENCSVPKGKSALAVVQIIRDSFFNGKREAEFMCVCDINKENREIIQELNDAQVTVVHINATSKNAADDKLRQSLRRFGNTHFPPATVVLISGDVNFSAELSDLRHRQKLQVILIHSRHVQDALITCAHEHYSFEELLGDLPDRVSVKPTCKELLITNLPKKELGQLRGRLKQLSDNCGGRVQSIKGSTARIRFPNADAATRAKKRMDSEDVFGTPICAKLEVGKVKDEKTSPPKILKKNRTDIKQTCSQPSPMRGSSSPKAENAVRSLKKARSPSSSPKAHSSPKVENATKGGYIPYKNDKTLAKQGITSRISPKPNKPGCYPGKPNLSAKKDHNFNNKTGGLGTFIQPDLNPNVRKRLDSVGPELIDASPQLKVMPRKYSDDKRYGLLVSYSGNSPSFCNSGHQPHSGSTSRQCSSSQGSSVLQSVHKFSKERKSSREIVLLQQQCFQDQKEQEKKQVLKPDESMGLDSFDSISVQCSSALWTAEVFGDPQHHLHYKIEQRKSSPVDRCSPNFNHPYAGESYFRPIRNMSPQPRFISPHVSPISGLPGVDLMVSNLDYNISSREWKKILQTTFQQQVQILHVEVEPQQDNTTIATVTVPSMDEARFAISQFHRKKIGYKRIHVCLKPADKLSGGVNTRYEVVALLRWAPGNTLPLFKFIELFEKRYHRNISVSELYKMREIVDIHDHGSKGRIVSLTSTGRSSPVLQPSSPEIQGSEVLEPQVCVIHCEESSPNYIQVMEMCLLPNILAPVRHFAAQVHTLLLNHDGCMPLMSFPCCYAFVFGPIQETEEGGVSMEHLISCVPGITIELSVGGVKKIKLAEKKPWERIEFGRSCPSPIMSYHLTQFSREIVDLLKHTPSSIMSFNQFIPSYHHHFGRQCRVADYGYTKLQELFEALPHVLHVLGIGNKRLLTLTHRVQIKRFQADLLRVLKAQPTKQITESELPSAFEKANGRALNMVDYGVCCIEDMLAEIPDTTAIVTPIANDRLIAIPRRDQTPEEIEHTRQFAAEVIELLKHSRQCRMQFNKFVPAYHHHFGRQCKVADYGFTKLIELFESIPDIVNIIEELDDKVLCLTESELLKVFADQTTALLNTQIHSKCSVPLQRFEQDFMRHHGYSVHFQDFKVPSFEQLLKKIDHVVRTEIKHGQKMVVLVDRTCIQQLAYRVLDLLFKQPDGSMRIVDLKSKYQERYHYALHMEEVNAEMVEVVEIHGNLKRGTVQLNSLQMFARNVRSLLVNQNKLPLSNFEEAYSNHYGVELNPQHYGYPTITSLLQAVSHMVTIRGKGTRRTILLCQDFLTKLSKQVANKSLPSRILSGPIEADRICATPLTNDSGIMDEDKEGLDAELIMLNQNYTSSNSTTPLCLNLIDGRVPSAVTSPALEPTVAPGPDLMRFSSEIFCNDILSGLTFEEKHAQRTPLCQTPTTDMLQFAAQFLPPVVATSPGSPEHQALISELHQMMNSSAEDVSPRKTPKKCRIAAKFNAPFEPPRNA